MIMGFDRRLQLLLDEERYRRVTSLAGARGTSVASVIREAIDKGLPHDDVRRTNAAAFLLAADPMAVPDVGELLDELDELRGRRA